MGGDGQGRVAAGSGCRHATMSVRLVLDQIAGDEADGN